MYKTALKISGILFSIVLIVCGISVYSESINSCASSSFRIYSPTGYNDFEIRFGLQSYDGYKSNIMHFEKEIEYDDDLSLSEFRDLTVLASSGILYDSLKETFNYNSYILSTILIVPGILMLIIFSCIKTPFDEKLIAKMKEKSKNKKKSKSTVQNVQTNSFCSHCGAELGVNNKFCPKCGTLANEATAVQSPVNY